MTTMSRAAEPIRDEQQLEERLSRPTSGTEQLMRGLEGDLLIIGVGGKMGPSLARLARRSADAAGRRDQRIIGVSRFTAPRLRQALEQERIETFACDVLDPQARATLPSAANVIVMLAHKFSGDDPPGKHWAVNTYLAGALAERYRDSRVVAFSTGNVYPLVERDAPQPTEATPPAPVGEYGASAWGRERMWEYASAAHGTRVSLIRLNYAVELRYGVLVDLAQQLLAGRPIDLSMPEVNFVWQGYANAVTLQALSLADSPAAILNVTGPERHCVRDLANGLAARLGVTATFIEPEGESALLNDASRCRELFGPPEPNAEQLMDLVAAWLRNGGRTLSKPTMFQVRDGAF